MKSTSILVALFAICVLWLTPNTTEASGGYVINDTTVVFFLDFGINASYGDFAIPVVADHTVAHNDRVDTLGYALTTDTDTSPAVATVTDLVLSKAPLVDTRYRVAKDEQAAFTLMSIVTFAEPITSDVILSITKLPFWVDDKRTSLHQNQIDELASVTASRESIVK